MVGIHIHYYSVCLLNYCIFSFSFFAFFITKWLVPHFFVCLLACFAFFKKKQNEELV